MEPNDEELAIPEDAIKEKKGTFVKSLLRGNKDIRADRALTIATRTEMLYKREIEDMTTQIMELRQEREKLIDVLSPASKDSLNVALGFDPKKFVESDVRLGVQIRNLEIARGIAQARYARLFTGIEPVENGKDKVAEPQTN